MYSNIESVLLAWDSKHFRLSATLRQAQCRGHSQEERPKARWQSLILRAIAKPG